MPRLARGKNQMFCDQILKCTMWICMVTITSMGDVRTEQSRHMGPCSSLPLSQTMSGRKGTSVPSPSSATLRAVGTSCNLNARKLSYRLWQQMDGRNSWWNTEAALHPRSFWLREDSEWKFTVVSSNTQTLPRGKQVNQNYTAFWQHSSNHPHQHYNKIHTHQIF